MMSRGESRDSDALEMWPWDEDGDSEEWFSPRSFAAAEHNQEEEYESTAVKHPFGRGQYKTVAQHVVIPPIVLDKLLKGKGRHSPWRWPADPEPKPRVIKSSSGSSGNTTKWRPVKTTWTWKGKMGGVHSPSPTPTASSRGVGQRGTGVSPRLKAKVSGRGRALKMRAEQNRAPLRKPGKMVSPCNYCVVSSCVCVCVCVYT